MLCVASANLAYLAGIDAVHAETCFAAGTGAPLARQLADAGYAAVSIDEDPEELAAITAPLSSGVVLESARVQATIVAAGCDAVLPFKSSSRLWPAAASLGLRVLAPPHKLVRQLENKLSLPDIARGAEARIPDTVTVRLDEDLVRAARAGDVALPRVFQPAVGFAGAGTHLVRDADELAAVAAQEGNAAGKLSEFIEGEPTTVNGVVIPPRTHGAGPDGEVLVGMVTRQLTGLAGLTPTDFGSCGNEWTLPPAQARVAATRSLARRVGFELAARGFVGAFGIDVVLPVDGGRPVLIEINPRWTASLALQVQSQAAAGLPDLLDAHLAAFEYRAIERSPLEALVAAYGPDDDAGITRGGQELSTVIAYNAQSRPVRIDPTAAPGIWSADGTQPRRPGWRLSDLEAEGELLVLPHAPGRDIQPGSYLVRAVLRGQAASSPAAGALLPEVAAMMQRIVERVTAQV